MPDQVVPPPLPPDAGGTPPEGDDVCAPTRIGRIPPPLLLDRYQVIRLLGRGASGEVLEVKDLSTNMSYAFKRISSEISAHQAQFQTLQSNFALVSQLAHPHIATTRFFERDPKNGDVCLLMDLVRGKSLAEYIADYRSQQGDPEAPLPISVVLGLAEQIAAALDYAHAQPSTWNPDGSPRRYGVLHRDLKPMNVMLESGREYRPGVPFVRLVDFGLAAEIQASLTSLSIARPEDNAICGTPSYMAPEQWEGRTLTRGVDQWALAVLIYEMVAGRPPFRAPSQMALMEQIRRAKPEKPDALTDAQWNALVKTFTVDRKDRYPSCVSLVRTLAQADPATAGLVQVSEVKLPDENPTKDASSKPAASAAPGVAAAEDSTIAPFPATTTVVPPPPARSYGWVLGLASVLLLLIAGGGIGGFLWFQHEQGAAIRQVVNEVTPVYASKDIAEVSSALERLEQAEREYPYASESVRVMLQSNMGRMRAYQGRLREAERKEKAYLAALQKAKRILAADDPDRLEEADHELIMAEKLAGTPERIQEVSDLRRQVARGIKERKKLMAIVLFTNRLESDVKTEAARLIMAKALLSRYRILPMERLYAAAGELKRGDLAHLDKEDLCRLAYKAGAGGVVRATLAAGSEDDSSLTMAAEMYTADRGLVQDAELEVKDLDEFVERLPLLMRILHMTDDEKDRFYDFRRRREKERLSEQERLKAEEERKRLEEEKNKAEEARKRLEEEKRRSEAEQKRLAEEKRKAEEAAKKERADRLKQERLAREEAAKQEARRKAAEAAAAAEKKRVEAERRAAQLAIDKARGKAQVRRVWVEHNQTHANMKGMMIHTEFAVQWRKDIPGHAIAFFYNKDGTKAVVPNGKGPYLAKDGHVAVWDNYKPGFDRTEWKDFKLFMPYYRFSTGEYTFTVQIRTNNFQTTLATSEKVSFKIQNKN